MKALMIIRDGFFPTIGDVGVVRNKSLTQDIQWISNI